ncbi:aminodeoxychorismate/anthranilate synthase component II [Fodinicola feengrottensis]|uniref:Aminodeoxychorismate/anthranilate synthase component II n=1 Tax=Fodinicola feengrottensis TaxID=435914 RepID=A0ABN2FWX3_9ACTN
MRAFVIDAYDSFVYVVAQYLRLLEIEVQVHRNDKIDYHDVLAAKPDLLMLGPGPGHPADAGYVDIVREVSKDIPTMGVCLGQQAIGLVFGAEVKRASHLMHGKTSVIEHDGKGCFSAYESPFTATRYHSLIVDNVTGDLEVTARAKDDGYVMGLRHREWPVESVQFHPESISTQEGLKVFRGFVETYVSTPVSA